MLIKLCEQYCMAVLLETMPHGHCSLGSGQHFDHRGPIAVGAEIETTVRCTEARDLRSRREVTVRDTHGVVGEGWMAFRAQAFRRRGRSKPRARAGCRRSKAVGRASSGCC